ncbi:MAG: hypothetical protein Q9219_005015 [cf. Caloplaca sp. 3 TL-2023]
MPLPYILLLLGTLALSATAANVDPFTGANAGFCYYCSNDGAPRLCNSQCEKAIDKLCAGDLTQGWTETEADCQLEYKPPVYGRNSNDKPVAPPADTCSQSFRGILNKCGKDASDSRTTYDPAYCTTSGGGGTYGWNDDGSVMKGTARYRIIAKASTQCGQHESPEHQATGTVPWNVTWVDENDQVVLDTSPPDAALNFTEPEPEDPLCQTKECDIFGKPFYAEKGRASWKENNRFLRHEVRFQGWAKDEKAQAFFDALTDRCRFFPQNFQAWFDGNVHLANFELPHYMDDDLCGCIADAVYDASGGITVDRNTWCESLPNQPPQFRVVGGADGELKKRIDTRGEETS